MRARNVHGLDPITSNHSQHMHVGVENGNTQVPFRTRLLVQAPYEATKYKQTNLGTPHPYCTICLKPSGQNHLDTRYHLCCKHPEVAGMRALRHNATVNIVGRYTDKGRNKGPLV